MRRSGGRGEREKVETSVNMWPVGAGLFSRTSSLLRAQMKEKRPRVHLVKQNHAPVLRGAARALCAAAR